jgi:hypothetical protein
VKRRGVLKAMVPKVLWAMIEEAWTMDAKKAILLCETPIEDC